MESPTILSHDRVTAPGAEPRAWWFFLHGIYGAGRNWASIARRLVRERPSMGVVLVDLRQHGGSQDFAPPHTLESAAADLRALAGSLGVRPAAVLGHSFGGKVALVYGREHGDALEQIWVVDSTPEARPPSGSAWEMLEVVRTLPDRFADRQELVGKLEAEGIATPVAQWMATNLEPADGGMRWRFDLDAIEALLHDFFETDLWPFVENPPEPLELHFVKAEDSRVLPEAACERVRRIGERTGRVFLHRVEGGHWVNAENPEALIQLVLAHGGLAGEIDPDK